MSNVKNSEIKILHLTHTDLRYDNRILKELDSILQLPNLDIKAFGILLNEKAAYSNQTFSFSLVNLSLITNRLFFLPKAIRYFFNLIELTSRFFFQGVRFRPSLIHCHDTMVLPVGVLLKIFCNCKLIYDAHELESDKNGQNLILSKSTLLIERVCWSKIDFLITVSGSILNWYSEHFRRVDGAVILNAPLLLKDVFSGSGESNYFRDKYAITFNEKIFVYVGQLGKGRSIEILIDIFQKAKVYSHIVFIGYGELEDFIRLNSLKFSNIHLHPPVPHEELVGLVSNADIGFCLIENISLSDYYCLPNKLFEYAFSGLKIIGSNFPEITSIINQYELGMCVSNNETDITQAVLHYQSLNINEKPKDISVLSWQFQAQKLRDVYKKLLFYKP